MDDYSEFLKSKVIFSRSVGFDCEDINDGSFHFQRAIIRWALKRGRCAVFADCGLGKTLIQLEWANRIHLETGGNVLIFAPLAVSSQTIREGGKFGIDVEYSADGSPSKCGITITNYERVEKFNTSDYVGVVLDESSILKSFSGVYKRILVEMFSRTRFRLCCTATPAPNDHMELGNHAEFLGIMPSNEMLARWFINDTMNFGSYRIKNHAIKDFWDWVSSWAVCVRYPSDIGYSDDGFVLPKLNNHIVEIDAGDEPTEGMLFRQPDMSATGMHKELKLTCASRASKVAEIIGDSTDPWVIWCNTNYEADELRKAIPDAVEVRGADKTERKEDVLLGFSEGRFKRLITKPDIAGFGMNWQHCNNQIFIGLSYSYEKYYQAIRRCWRFGQKNPVNVYVVMSDTERPLYDTVMEKQAAHTEMQEAMYSSMSSVHQLREELELTDKPVRVTESGSSWDLILGDSCEAIKDVEDSSVGMSIFSPPFSSLYIYSDSIRDMGNCTDDDEFFRHLRFLIPEIKRITQPGRLCAVHCKQLVYYKNTAGTAGLRDFRGEITRAFVDAGWDYHSEVCIWKDPVTEMQRTKSHGLLHKQLCKDSTFSRQGLPDYLLLFRKWAAEGDEVDPVKGQSELVRFDHYIGNGGPNGAKTKRDFSIQVWQRYASPVWFDIRQTNVLNVRQAKGDGDEKHICPLQLDVISRAVHLWTNEGDLVFSPFAGIGSEGYEAIRLGRRFLGIELKPEYFEQAKKNLDRAERLRLDETRTLFDEVTA